MSFNWLNYKHLAPSVRGIIMQKQKSESMSGNTQAEKAVKQDIYPIHIFMRLGISSSNQYNGKETMKIYESFCNQNHSVWFSTNSLASGMAKGKIDEFIKAINNGLVVEIYFAIGKNSGGNNQIEYKAQVIDIKSDSDGINSPENSLTPIEWRDNKNKIWIKIQKLAFCDGCPIADDFIVVSSGNMLSKAIAKSQYNLGYIKKA